MSRVSSLELGRNDKEAAPRTTATRPALSEGRPLEEPSLQETVLELVSTLAGIVGVMLILLALVRITI
jgi:hypothetical protein